MAEPVFRLRTWVRASDADEATGLLGWISVEYGALIIDNITLRRTNDGRLVLSFPSRTAKNKAKHSIVRPVDDETRIAIEREIMRQLVTQEGAAS